ncbi:endolytic transglycosylase MltG [Candidatus Falkowbacteria bacterium]|nr:endolytic transglycosylase MltG [Candidatus Falkowbacteria bacterium]
MFFKKKPVIILLIIVITLLIITLKFNISRDIGVAQTFVIEKGQGLSEIAHNLVQQKIINHQFGFEFYAIITGNYKTLLAGKFFLPQKISIKDLVKILTNEKFMQLETEITIIEGWDKNEIADYLEQKQLVDKKTFLKAAADLEGFLYPDTYRIYQATTADEIIKKMLDNFNTKLTVDLKNKIEQQHKTTLQILTMASIIEKEMTGLENRKIASGIFWKRIKEGHPLQSDATINYITQKGMIQPNYADLEIENPYNTYKNYGLPPGPICNPSIEAIIAAIEPTSTPYYYFLTTKAGTVIFSKTYDEHLKNKQKYLN